MTQGTRGNEGDDSIRPFKVEVAESDYDLHRCAEKLNALPNFITEIDGLDIHFIHVKSRHEAGGTPPASRVPGSC
jgi:Epoxide hydrolase N terminus